MADSIATPLFKATIGWLVNKGRSIAGRNLRHGDVFEQLLCDIVARELDTINSKLDALAEQHLGAAISSYREGVNCMAEEDELDGPPAKRMKIDANECFQNALDDARLAFNTTSLGPEKRILAAYIRIMAKLLQNVDDPSLALKRCKQYLMEMHDKVEEVKSNFSLKCHPSPGKRLAARFAPNIIVRDATKRLHNVIWSVCQVNRILFDINQMIGESRYLFVWPCVTCNCGFEVIDPLRDPRLGLEMDVIWTFDQQEEEHKLIRPRSIASNSEGEYLVVDSSDIKAFDRNGKYQYSLSGLIRDREGQYHVVDIDTDQHGSVYLLVSMVSRGHAKGSYEVFVLDEERKLRQFPLRNNSKGRKLAVNQHLDKTELLVLEGEKGLLAMVEVYETDGTFVCQFGERILQDAQDIVGSNNGHTYVLDKCHEFNQKYIREFGARGDQLRRFAVTPETIALAFHRPSEHIVFISRTPEEEKKLSLSILSYNQQKNSVLRTYKLDVDEIPIEQNVAVTFKGRIAVVVAEQIDGKHRGKVIVF